MLSEHFGNASLTAAGEGIGDRAIHDRDIDWLRQADVIVAEVGRDFKKVMPLAAQALRGTADGKLVNEVVREATT